MMALCGEPIVLPERPEAITNPTLIVEVLSKSTESYDRGDKALYYQQIESLREYVMVDQYARRVDYYRRASSGEGWVLSRAQGAGAELEITGLGVTLSLDQLYARTRPLVE